MPVCTVAELVLPPGSPLDAAFVFAVATRTNAAHAALGTELLGVEPHGATIRVLWRADLTADGEGTWAGGVVSSLLDHVCSLAALMSLGDPRRYGGTLGLRVEHVRPLGRCAALVAHGLCEPSDGDVLRVDGRVFADDVPDDTLARGRCTIAVHRVGGGLVGR